MTEDPPVVLIKPGGEKDITYVGPSGPIRFVEGRAEVPLSVARKLAGPGWWTEKIDNLAKGSKR
jgi:hypothetical protein